MDSLVDGVNELFGYNRKGYFFDQKLRLLREYQEQDMRIKQFMLYREDIRDLTELTTGKMDSYLLITLLELGICVVLLVEGVLRGFKDQYPPAWLLFLYVVSLAEAFLYLFLSAWLATHASVAAHSFSVRLLTQFVRLPVPNRRQMDAARAYAADFEGRVQDLLRVPVWRQQMKNLDTSILDDRRGLRGSAGPHEAADRIIAMQELNPAVALKHIRVYRNLQSNWQAHDAYARACMALGTYTLVHAVSYYCIGLFAIELATPLPALGCSILLLSTAWMIIRLDLYFGTRTSKTKSVTLLAGPVIACAAVVLDWRNEHISLRYIAEILLVPLVFLLHAALIIAIGFVARAEQVADGGAALPTRFRAVLYLDVFGWLSGPDSSVQTGDTQSVPQERASSSPVVQAVELPSASEPEAGPERGPPLLPPCLGDAIRCEGRALIASLQQELRAWESHANAANLRAVPQIAKVVSRLRSQFQHAQREFTRAQGDRFATATAESTSSSAASLSCASGEIWLKLSWNAGTRQMEYFIHAESGEARREAPADAFISDISGMRRRLACLQEQSDALQSAEHSCRQPTQGRFHRLRVAGRGLRSVLTRSGQSSGSGASCHHDNTRLPVGETVASASPSPSTHEGQVLMSEALASSGATQDARETVSRTSTLTELERSRNIDTISDAQETRFGGEEAARFESNPDQTASFRHSEIAAQTFYPRREGVLESQRAPGQVPWTTFLVSSALLVIVWLAGVLCYIVFPIAAFVSQREHVEWESLVSYVEAQAPTLEGERRLLSHEQWPQRVSSWQPVALACDSELAPFALLAERHAVYEVRLDVFSTLDNETSGWQPVLRRATDIDECLARAPEILSMGLAGVSLECSGLHCIAVLLSSNGDRVLRCPVRRGASNARASMPSQARAPPVIVTLAKSLAGQSWTSLAVSPRRPGGQHVWWGLSSWTNGTLATKPTQLRVRYGGQHGARAFPGGHCRPTGGEGCGGKCGLMHRHESLSPTALRRNPKAILQAASSVAYREGVRGLHSIGQGRLIGLSGRGRLLHAWEYQKHVGVWKLPGGTVWSAACARGAHMYVVGFPTGRATPELWRYDLPTGLRPASH